MIFLREHWKRFYTLQTILYWIRRDSGLQYKQVLTENEYQDAREAYGYNFRVGMGAESIMELLKAIDLEKDAAELKAELVDATGQKRARIIKRLEVVESSVNQETVRNG